MPPAEDTPPVAPDPNATPGGVPQDPPTGDPAPGVGTPPATDPPAPAPTEPGTGGTPV